MRGFIYGDIKEKLLEIRAKQTDKIIKCYIITKSLNVYPITRISKRNVYYTNEIGEEVSVKEFILEVYEDTLSVCTAVSKLKVLYEAKIQNLYKVLHKINEVEGYFNGFKKGGLK
jgi:hypothetical protein